MNLESWLEEQNTLTVGDDPNKCVKLVDAQGETWATWAIPAKSETISSFFSTVREQLATGRHQFFLVSFSADDEPRARMARIIDGGSSVAKAAQTDEITRAKATAMNIDIAERQLSTMARRLEEADERARKMEERAGDAMELMWQLADRVKENERDNRKAELEVEEREARIAFVKEMAGQAAPLLGLLVPLIMKKLSPPETPAASSASVPVVPSPPSPPSPQLAPEPDKPYIPPEPVWPTRAEQEADENPPTEVTPDKSRKKTQLALVKPPKAPAKKAPKKAPKKPAAASKG